MSSCSLGQTTTGTWSNQHSVTFGAMLHALTTIADSDRTQTATESSDSLLGDRVADVYLMPQSLPVTSQDALVSPDGTVYARVPYGAGPWNQCGVELNTCPIPSFVAFSCTLKFGSAIYEYDGFPGYFAKFGRKSIFNDK